MNLKKLSFAIMTCSLCSNLAFAATETENNNSFASRNILAAGVRVVDGEIPASSIVDLNSLTPDYSYQDSLSPDQIISHSISGHSPSTPFIAAVDNGTSGVDTILGAYDQNNVLVGSNDDSSPLGDGNPLGDGVGSALGGQVNSDGTINLQVTGFPDDDFAGSHDESGDFDLNVYLGVDAIGDVDYFSFTGLQPGAQMKAQITNADFDTTLGLFDNAGNLISSSDDIDDLNILSSLIATVDTTGAINLAVSGYPDTDFKLGSSSEFGQYQLALTAVPVPAAVWLFGSGLLGLVGFGRHTRRA